MENNASGQGGVKLNQFEYAYAVEAFKPSAEFIKVYIPKLMAKIPAQPKKDTKQILGGIFNNSFDCKVTSSNTVTTQGYILAKVVAKRNHQHPWFHCYNTKYGEDNCPNRVHDNTCEHKSILRKCVHEHWHYDFDNEKVDGGNIPAGAKLIVMFMDNNINDCWVTRFICEY